MTDPLTPTEIAEARRLCEAATPGPWRCIPSCPGSSVEGPDHERIVSWSGRDRADADCRMIAAARTLVPRLLDEVDRLRSEHAEAGKAVELAERLLRENTEERDALAVSLALAQSVLGTVLGMVDSEDCAEVWADGQRALLPPPAGGAALERERLRDAVVQAAYTYYERNRLVSADAETEQQITAAEKALGFALSSLHAVEKATNAILYKPRG